MCCQSLLSTVFEVVHAAVVHHLRPRLELVEAHRGPLVAAHAVPLFHLLLLLFVRRLGLSSDVSHRSRHVLLLAEAQAVCVQALALALLLIEKDSSASPISFFDSVLTTLSRPRAASASARYRHRRLRTGAGTGTGTAKTLRIFCAVSVNAIAIATVAGAAVALRVLQGLDHVVFLFL